MYFSFVLNPRIARALFLSFIQAVLLYILKGFCFFGNFNLSETFERYN